MIGKLVETAFATLQRFRAERALLILQSVLAALAILPFGIWRLRRGEVAQGAFDIGLVVLLLGMAWLARSARWTRTISRGVAFVYVFSSVIVTQQFGVLGQFWFFPAVVATFFVVRSAEALMLALAGLSVHLWITTSSAAWDAREATFLATSLLVCVFIHLFASRLRFDNTRLYLDSTVDSLTGAGNRRLLDDTLAAQTSPSAGSPSTMLMIDVDHFKSVNDLYGHQTGDLCLQRLAARLTDRIGPSRKLYRAGGEEFVVLTALPRDEAVALAEALRADVAATPLIREAPVTISIGVATRRPDESVRDWMRRADDAMYTAKNLGRNRVHADA